MNAIDKLIENRKRRAFLPGIIMGIISCVTGMIFVGIPFNMSILSIVNLVVFFFGAMITLYSGAVRRKYKSAVYAALAGAIISFILTYLMERSGEGGYSMLHIGFIYGLIVAITGLISCIRMGKSGEKVLPGIIVNSIGILAGLLSGAISIISYVMRPNTFPGA